MISRLCREAGGIRESQHAICGCGRDIFVAQCQLLKQWRRSLIRARPRVVCTSLFFFSDYQWFTSDVTTLRVHVHSLTSTLHQTRFVLHEGGGRHDWSPRISLCRSSAPWSSSSVRIIVVVVILQPQTETDSSEAFKPTWMIFID